MLGFLVVRIRLQALAVNAVSIQECGYVCAPSLYMQLQWGDGLPRVWATGHGNGCLACEHL